MLDTGDQQAVLLDLEALRQVREVFDVNVYEGSPPVLRAYSEGRRPNG